jgi:hypothetical protein
MRRFRAVATVALLAGACSGSPAAPGSSTPAKDAVTAVTNMNPPPGTALQAGQTVTLSGTPVYTLASTSTGLMSMVIEDQNNRLVPASSAQTVLVHQGSGDATLTQAVTLPAAGVSEIHVFFLLAPTGNATTAASVSVSYPVR